MSLNIQNTDFCNISEITFITQKTMNIVRRKEFEKLCFFFICSAEIGLHLKKKRIWADVEQSNDYCGEWHLMKDCMKENNDQLRRVLVRNCVDTDALWSLVTSQIIKRTQFPSQCHLKVKMDRILKQLEISGSNNNSHIIVSDLEPPYRTVF